MNVTPVNNYENSLIWHNCWKDMPKRTGWFLVRPCGGHKLFLKSTLEASWRPRELIFREFRMVEIDKLVSPTWPHKDIEGSGWFNIHPEDYEWTELPFLIYE